MTAHGDLEISETPLAGACVIAVGGEIDLATAPELSSRLGAAIDRGQYRLVIDLRAVRFMDSSIIKVVLRTLRRLRRSSDGIALVAREAHALRVLELTGVTRVINVFETVEEAATSLERKPRPRPPAGDAAGSPDSARPAR